MRILGIDYGRRRIGIAVTDEDGRCIRGLTTIDRNRHPDPIIPLLAIIVQENPSLLVVGVPLSIDDEETNMSREIREFTQILAQHTAIPIHYIDESLTSIRAAEVLRFRKKKERRDKASVDRVAACLIIEEYRKEHGWDT